MSHESNGFFKPNPLKRNIFKIVLSALVLTYSQSIFAASTSFSEYAATGEPPAVVAAIAPPPAALFVAGVTTYTDPAVFSATTSGVTLEDFSGTIVAANTVLGCTPGSLDSTTNNTCFATGGVAPGFTLSADNDPAEDLAVATPPQFGLASVSVAPNTLTDDTRLDFTLPNSAVSFELVSPLSDEAYVIEAYDDTGASLGTTTVNATGVPAFFGVTSPLGISRIVIRSVIGTGGELISNLQFGAYVPKAVPTINEFGIFSLILILMMTGLLLKRKES